jgi:hypothetical protein
MKEGSEELLAKLRLLLEVDLPLLRLGFLPG